MIHSVAVLGGASLHAKIAQRHAIQMALLFQARLRVVVTWDAENTEKALADGAPDEILQSLVDAEMENVTWEVGKGALQVERSVQGGGLVQGALAAADESDLLVVGLTDQETQERSLLPKADCLVLAVHQPPQRLQRILVDYQGGKAGKAALRIAGEVALRADAAVTVLCVSGDSIEAGTLAATAERYLEAFGLRSVDKIEHRGSRTSQNEVLHAANSITANLIVVGQERQGLLAGLLHKATIDAEGLAEEIDIPVLIAG
jgi:nucleotide-binding universal stress UspA family protein